MKNLCGHPIHTLAENYADIQEYLKSHDVDRDRYGEGAFLNDFEAEMAATLGMEAAVFLPSGVMAQLVAIKVWGDRAGSNRFACHESCHLIRHEEDAYRELLQFEATLVGEPDRVPMAADLAPLEKGTVSSLVYELPLRHLGGDLPTWDEWLAIKQHCRDQDIRLHIDGARLFETQTHFAHSAADIVRGTDSVFLSFYKGFGSTSGSMLMGSVEFIRQARIWIRRFGGNLYQIYGLAVPARLNYAKQVARFPDYVAKARSIAEVLHDSFGLQITPYPVKTNMFHVVLPVAPDLLKARLDGWSEAKLNLPIWTDASPAGMSRCEFTAGEATLAFPDTEIAAIFSHLLRD